MRGSFQFKKDYAVSEIVGGIILVLIAVAVFSVIYLDVTSKDLDVYHTNVKLEGSINDTGFIVLEHKGGDVIKSYKVYVSYPNGAMISSETYYDNWAIGEYRYPTDIKLVDGMSLSVAVYTTNEDGKEQEIFKGELLYEENDPPVSSIPPDDPSWNPEVPLLISSLRNDTIDEDLICYTLSTCVNITPFPEFFDCDVDMDWQIDGDDVDLVGAAIGSSGSPGWIREDVNDDGFVDNTDKNMVESNYGVTQLRYIYKWMANGNSITDILMPFDTENLGGDEIKDYSGNMNNGTIFGPVWSVSGIKGGAYNFDGDDDYISLPYCFDGSYIDEITVETWINTDSNSAPIAAFGGGDYWELGSINGNIRWSTTANGDTIETNGDITVNDLDWHQVAATYNHLTGDCAIYVDGKIDKVENMHNPSEVLGDGSNPDGFIGTSSSSVIEGGWNLLTYDDFENGFGNYSAGGRDCNLYTGGTYAHQGSNAADIQDNSGGSSSFYHTNGIDVATPGYTSLKVDFWFRAKSMEYNEDFWVRFYDGNQWRTVADYDRGDEFVNGQFYHEIVWINETDYTFPTNMKIRFQCDASTDYDDVYIDQVYVNATVGDITTSNYSGMIDEFCIYNRVLTAEQIYQNYLCMKDDFSDRSVIVSDETSMNDDWQCNVTPNNISKDGTMVESNTLQIGVYEGG